LLNRKRKGASLPCAATLCVGFGGFVRYLWDFGGSYLHDSGLARAV
jgi:hypothetical protein